MPHCPRHLSLSHLILPFKSRPMSAATFPTPFLLRFLRFIALCVSCVPMKSADTLVGIGEKEGMKRAKIGEGELIFPLSAFLRGEGAAVGELASCGAEGSLDPLVVFCSGVMMMILEKLDLRSLAVARVVSSGWLALASADKLWGPKCEELWLGKAHIPRISKARGLSKMAATSLFIMDGKRNRITRNDMCDHEWEFHFTEAAPSYWKNLDPYWGAAGPPMKRYFHPDGTVTADPWDRVWGGHESSYTVVTGILGDGKIRQHYVRINRWPQMSVHRNPDWSWVLSNHLYCYSSIPDAQKEEGTGPFFPMF